MSMQIRWKEKERIVKVPFDPGVIGSPTTDMIETYKVLQFKYCQDGGPISEWMDVPVARVDEE